MATTTKGKATAAQDARFWSDLGTAMKTKKALMKTALSKCSQEVEFEDGQIVTYKPGKADSEAEWGSEYEGFQTKMGEVESASGHKFHALIDICVEDSGENYGIAVWTLTGFQKWDVLRQGTKEFDAWVKKMEKRVPGFKMFPYRYRYFDRSVRHLDHHVDENTGWSHR